ncbi:MAG: hypothetical protein ACKO66_04095 [Flavobacteriales bacterium]
MIALRHFFLFLFILWLCSCGLHQESEMAVDVCACMQPTESLVSKELRDALINLPADDLTAEQLKSSIEKTIQEFSKSDDDKRYAGQIFQEGMLADCLTMAQSKHHDAITLDAVESLRAMSTALEKGPCKLSALAFTLRSKQWEEAE